jgi:hypothetical protein
MEVDLSSLAMTPERIARNVEAAYRRWEAWKREDAAAKAIIAQKTTVDGSVSG